MNIKKELEHIDNRNIPAPPKPLILNGWVFSSDQEKRIRWHETLEWINKYMDNDVIGIISEDEKYFG